MASDVKWVKLTTDMFDNRKIKHLRRLPEGNSIVLIWVMLLTMAGRCNAGGMIFLTENIPYTPKMLADELDFEENTVQLALKALEQLNMIVTDHGFFAIAGWEEYQNVDRLSEIREYNRIAKQKSRAKQRALQAPVDGVNDKSMTCQRGHDTEEDKEEDIEKEKEKSVRENTHTIFKRLLPEYNLSSALAEKMGEWVKYKVERKEPYKEQGMKSLLRQIENNYMQFGEQAVCDLIDESMANGWKGIIFDRLKKKPQGAKPVYQNRTKADELHDFYRMAAQFGESE